MAGKLSELCFVCNVWMVGYHYSVSWPFFSGTTHSFSEEEKIAFVDWINYQLEDDPDVKKTLPVSEEGNGLFTAVHDGIVLWWAPYVLCLSYRWASSPRHGFTMWEAPLRFCWTSWEVPLQIPMPQTHYLPNSITVLHTKPYGNLINYLCPIILGIHCKVYNLWYRLDWEILMLEIFQCLRFHIV